MVVDAIRTRARPPRRPADAARVADTYNYNQDIAERGSTFETSQRTAHGIARRIADDPQRFLILVAEAEGSVIGWAGISAYRPRKCYEGIGEFSIYLDKSVRGRGVGKQILNALIAAAAGCGYWKLLSRIFPSNVASLALCKTCGFREVGVYEKHVSSTDTGWTW